MPNKKDFIKTKLGMSFLVFAFVFDAFMYFPFWLYIPAIDPFWSKMYLHLSPFGIVPYIVGVISLVISAKYNRKMLSILFAYMYVQAISISFIRAMGATGLMEYVVFMPHILIIGLHIYIWAEKISDRS